jgi:copper chaperone NosL
MRKTVLLAALAGALALQGCNDRGSAEAPPPFELTDTAIGHYCGMNLVEHAGPKGQIILAGRKEPVWFSSARDAISFTLLPEEPKDIQAIYVSDMGKAPTWERPGIANWTDAKRASFVIGSRMKGGMGADETVPFSDRGAAETFAREHGGRVVAFADVPKDYVLGPGPDPTNSVESALRPAESHGDHTGAVHPPISHAH